MSDGRLILRSDFALISHKHAASVNLIRIAFIGFENCLALMSRLP